MSAAITPKPMRSVVAYIVRDGLMLSVPRNTGEHAAPGGKVERDEHGEYEPWELALSREVQEEIGCAIISAWRVHSGCVNGYRVQIYRVEILGEPVAREAGTRIDWVRPGEIANGFASALHSVGVRMAGLI